MKSPCIKVCKIDFNSKVCVGCGRTLTQIRCWSNYTDEERRLVMKWIENGSASAQEEDAKDTN
jgi:hypothetical protein